MKWVIVVVGFCLCTFACSIKKGDFEQELLRIKAIEGHINIERIDTQGLVIDTIGQNGAPKIVIGKVNHSQLILPLKTCTKYYDEEGNLTHEICEAESNVSLEAKIDGKGAYAGDMIGTGEAAILESGYKPSEGSMVDVWIQSLVGHVEEANIEAGVKKSFIDMLKDLGNKIPAGGDE